MEPPIHVESQTVSKLLDQYGCGPIHFAGTDSGPYERHLLFDNVIDLGASDARNRFEAFARSVRDLLSQRWILTENTYASANAKRVYYLSMEF
jgi:starch phosphorylase